MIEIRNLRGELAELNPDTSITIERNNPLFTDDDKIFEDITYSFNLPASDSNKIFFDWGHLVETENKAYEKEVQCVFAGFPFAAGLIRYSFNNGEFEGLLKVNFGALAEKVKTVKLTDIYTNDIIDFPVSAEFMKTVCQNPSDYPFSFFSVKNTNWDGTGAFHYPIVNAWHNGLQVFIFNYNHDLTGSPPPNTPQSAYFKLKYILIKVFEYLGFVPEGTFMNDASNDEIYIYNRIFVPDYMYESSYYFPRGFTIADFFKILKNDPRFKISMSFDVLRGRVKVESAVSQLNSTEIENLQGYISKIEQIAIPDVNGYLISLRPDVADDMFIDMKDTSKHVATNKLLIGNGEKNVEVEASTLKTAILADDIIIPEVKQKIQGATENVPIRFLRYSGMKSVADSKIFPIADVMELSEGDSDWYRFLNDSKKLKIKCSIPINVLYGLETSKKIGFVSNEGNYIIAIPEKISFNLTNEDVELIQVDIECRTVVYNKETSVSIIPVETEVIGINYGFKAFFDLQSGIENVHVEMFYPAGTVLYNGTGTNITLTEDVIKTGTIKKSSDKFRGGGDLIYLERLLVLYGYSDVEVRVYIEPKYLIYLGKTVYFSYNMAGYWIATPINEGNWGKWDYAPVWIVF